MTEKSKNKFTSQSLSREYKATTQLEAEAASLNWVAALVAAVAFVAVMFTMQQTQLSSVRGQVDGVRAESRRYSNLIAQKRHAERLRDDTGRAIA